MNPLNFQNYPVPYPLLYPLVNNPILPTSSPNYVVNVNIAQPRPHNNHLPADVDQELQQLKARIEEKVNNAALVFDTYHSRRNLYGRRNQFSAQQLWPLVAEAIRIGYEGRKLVDKAVYQSFKDHEKKKNRNPSQDCKGYEGVKGHEKDSRYPYFTAWNENPAKNFFKLPV